MTGRRAGAPGRTVVVTGCGAVTPIGLGVADFWSSLLAGRSGVGPITRFDATDYPTRIAAEITDFEPQRYVDRASSRRLSRVALFAIAAAGEAIESAKLAVEGGLGERTGVLVGSGYGATQLEQDATLTLHGRGPRWVPPHFISTGAIDSAAGEIALRWGATGPSAAMTTACATGTTCVGEAARWIRLGLIDVAIAGGSDDSVTPVEMAAAGNAKALSRRNDDPERASRPFDRDRDGFIMGCGAGIVVLESLDHAQHRGAPVLAEIAGYGASTDAHHVTAPHPEGLGARRAMRQALDDAGVHPGEVDYVNAHGTSTRLNDAIETAALRAVLGDRATRIPISSIKSMTGHMIGAAGTTELIATILALREGMVPPTINCDNPEDHEINYVPHEPQHWDARVAMSNSFGFGGHNAVLVVRRWED